MIRRGTGKCILCGVILLLVAFFSLNFYILKELNESDDDSPDIETRIINHARTLGSSYWIQNEEYKTVFHRLQLMFNAGAKPKWSKSPAQLYKLVNKVRHFHLFIQSPYLFSLCSFQWPVENRIYPLYEPLISEVIRALQTDEIRKVDISAKGTQLKLHLLLSGNQTVVFKPKWYDRTEIIEGSVYAGKDRFNSEIFAFYLGALLQLNWTPLATGRKLNVKDVYERLSTARLKKTFVLNETSYCFYGQCHYCDASNLVCGHRENNYELEGVLLFVIPGQFSRRRSPWQRTYKEGVPAEWQLNLNYCEAHVKGQLSDTRLLDLIDGAIFDFLIQNGDRHHYETRDDRLLLLDNGKGFGSPNKDFLDILAPLYQCCTLRLSTYERLLMFKGGWQLSGTIKELTKIDALHPILTQSHYTAVERRLLLVFSAIDICKERQGKAMFV